MGRHRRFPTNENDVKRRTSFKDTEEVDERVVKRLGLDNQICSNCNANNPPDAETCRRCGSADLRPKSSDFSDS